MVRRWIPLVACAAGAMWLGACSSDTPSSSTDDSSSSSLASSATTSPAPTTTVASSVAATTTTTAAATDSTQSSAGTSTTIAGRVVTSPSDSVKLGDSGDGVTQIQTALKAKGYNVVVDGQFGPQTDAAVRAYQKKSGLTQDGVVGPKTWASLSGSGGASGGTDASTTTVAATTTTG